MIKKAFGKLSNILLKRTVHVFHLVIYYVMEKANWLNSYFTSISTVDDNHIMLLEIQLITLKKLVIDEITISEVKDIIHSIDIN